ncbi:NAD-dependent epimerase/dehydratase family protein [Micromonospora sp. NPDC051227]|uniref:NAD-dependent epimerase/dehydratase family protein n=1 Tax=Micromonospora sp. NPDC051227 TaxID=3364285 RepID=UPI0037AEEE2D
MPGKKVLVTGASGFIGQYVTRELLAMGRTVVAFDRLQTSHAMPPGVHASLGDIRDPVAVHEAMSQAESWIHLAGVLGTQETIANPRPAIETNIVGGINILEAAAHYGLPGVNIAVGNWFEQNPYSISKSTVERFCEMYTKFRGVSVAVVRGFNSYGPGQALSSPYGSSKVRKIVPAFVARAINGEPIEIYGDGHQIMDTIYVADLARILARALFKIEGRPAENTVYEAGTGHRTTVLDIANEVIRCVGRGSINHLPMRPGETPGAVVLANPATLGELGVDPRDLTGLPAGIERTVAYYRQVFRDQ